MRADAVISSETCPSPASTEIVSRSMTSGRLKLASLSRERWNTLEPLLDAALEPAKAAA